MSQRSAPAVLVTCEHASAQVPARFGSAFRTTAAKRALGTHRGSDLHAAAVARALAKALAKSGVPSSGPIEGRVTRLLVDLNRSPTHATLFSEFSKRLTGEQRSALLREYYAPHHAEVRAQLALLLNGASRVVHIGVHSFTPVLRGEVRNADIGLLYDPRRQNERTFAHACRAALLEVAPAQRVRLNYPYRGIADGLTTMLRREIGGRYIGIEIELNQGTLERTATMTKAVVAALIMALR